MSGRGTTSDTSAVVVGFSNARAVPTSATIAKMLELESQPETVPITSAAAAAACTNWQIEVIRRRS